MYDMTWIDDDFSDEITTDSGDRYRVAVRSDADASLDGDVCPMMVEVDERSVTCAEDFSYYCPSACAYSDALRDAIRHFRMTSVAGFGDWRDAVTRWARIYLGALAVDFHATNGVEYVASDSAALREFWGVSDATVASMSDEERASYLWSDVREFLEGETYLLQLQKYDEDSDDWEDVEGECMGGVIGYDYAHGSAMRDLLENV